MSDIIKLKRTPLYENHIKLHARLVPFAGWEMPVQYSGIIKEHMHTRTFNSVFDICHMGEFIIEGMDAEKDLENLLTCRVSTLAAGRSRYGFLLNENGCFIDDLIVFKYSRKRFMLVVNASRIETDSKWIREHLSGGSTFTDISEDTAKIDLQGPRSFETASLLFPDISLICLGRFSFEEFEYNGINITASTTGYTGEPGFEFFMPRDSAPFFWEHLLSIETVQPAGLGARDSLRLEKGFSLYGHDITDRITPVEADLERFIDYNKIFIGIKRLQQQTAQTPEKVLTPFLCEGRRNAREGYKIFKNGKEAGYVTSGVYSPVLKKGIGLALIDQSVSVVGSVIECRDGETKINAIIVDLPFVR